MINSGMRYGVDMGWGRVGYDTLKNFNFHTLLGAMPSRTMQPYFY